MRPLTKSQIKASLPSPYNRSSSPFVTLANAKKAFGPHLIRLTRSVARDLEGQRVYVLEEQAWNDLVFKDPELPSHGETKQERLKAISSMKIGSRDGEDLNVQMGKHKYQAYYFKNGYVTGSGADPIFVFAERD